MSIIEEPDTRLPPRGGPHAAFYDPFDVLRVAGGKQIFFSLPKAYTGDEHLRVAAKVGTHAEFELRTDEPPLIKLRLNKAAEHFERACTAYREGPRCSLRR